MNNPTILYVDDEEVNLFLFKINLKGKYPLLTAEDGLKGLEIIDANPDIKVVISDMRMPIMNGLEFISKAKEKHPEINYYILTGFEITEEIQNALDQELILKYFRKPCNLSEIDAEIERLI